MDKNTTENKTKNGFRFKIVLTILALVLLFAGVLIILKGQLNNTPITIKNETPDKPIILKANQYTPLDKLEIKPIDTTKFNFGTEIGSPFMPFINKVAYLQVDLGDNFILGKLDTENKFKVLYSLTNNVKLFRLFEDDSLAYIAKDDFGKESLVVTVDTKPSTLYTFKSGEIVSSFFYEPKEKLFYLSLIYDDGSSKLAYIDRQQSLNPLLSVLTKDLDSEIKYVDPLTNNVFIEKDGKCKELDVQTKVMASVNCNNIRTNAGLINVVNNLRTIDIYNLQNGTIKTVNKNDKAVLGGFVDLKVLLRLQKDSTLDPTGDLIGTNWPSSTTKASVIVKDISFPEKVTSLFSFSNKTYIVVSDPLAKLYEYMPQTIPVSYPAGTDLTYKDWKEINLVDANLPLKISLLNSNPSF